MHARKSLASPLPSLGLVGDGDEIDAVIAVEHAFGVSLDYQDSRNWRCAGDVYDALLKALGTEPVGAWRHFATALAANSGACAGRIFPETMLLG